MSQSIKRVLLHATFLNQSEPNLHRAMCTESQYDIVVFDEALQSCLGSVKGHVLLYVIKRLEHLGWTNYSPNTAVLGTGEKLAVFRNGGIGRENT